MRLVTCFLAVFICMSATAQKTKTKTAADTPPAIIEEEWKALKWRNLGPTRGGRSVAATGVVGQPLVYYMGSTGGGLWKTEDAGISWHNISDGFFKTGSVGAIAVSESDPNVVYVGMGEHAVRGVMTSAGDGVYKSTDAGKTWSYIGLASTMHIAAIRIHPSNPDVVMVAAQGAVHGATDSRGVYISTDGGINWKRTLFVNNSTGCSDLSLDMTNPRIVYAAMWDHIRRPWEVVSGGPGSGLYKSTDGGFTWHKLSNGLPAAMGKTAIDVSRADNNRVYANIEAEGNKGGVYRSDDGGESWKQVNSQRVTVARAWYYIEIFADPQQADKVFVLNAPALVSTDGGKTFANMPTPHGDNHWLWIDPQNNKRMINANDGGANISFNGGGSWSTQTNQPTAQFYRVIADRQFPYHLYAGQQDNTSLIVPSQSASGMVDWQQWKPGPGGESAFLAFDPDNPARVYGGSYHGNIEVWEKSVNGTKDIMANPTIGLAETPKNLKYRFNWNAPIVADPFAPSVIWHAGNKILRTADGGQSWSEISPDLTRNDSSKQGDGGKPYTNEGAGGEVYNTISSLAPSFINKGEWWAGSDCGLVHLTRDGGATWTNITPAGLPECLINAIEVSPHDAGRAWAVATRYKFNDFEPMVYMTTDYGKTWTKTTEGFEAGNFVRVVHEDKVRKGLLYAGTERGLFISFNHGKNWQRFQLNLPVVAITDLTIAANDLVAATSGRAFWILHDLSPLQQAALQENNTRLFQPAPAIRTGWGGGQNEVGANAPEGVCINYFLPSQPDTAEVRLRVMDSKGQTLASFSSKKNEAFKSYSGGPQPNPVLPAQKGLNRFYWNFRRSGIPGVENVFVNGDYRGTPVAPGEYNVALIIGKDSLSTTAKVLANPNIKASQADFDEQYRLMSSIDDQVMRMHQQVSKVRSVKKQLESTSEMIKNLPEADTLTKAARKLSADIDTWQNKLVSTRQETFQDVINFYNRLNADLLDLRGRMENASQPKVPEGHKKRLAELMDKWNSADREYAELAKALDAFNALYREKNLPVVIMPK